MAFIHEHEKYGMTFPSGYFRINEVGYTWTNEPKYGSPGDSEKLAKINVRLSVYTSQEAAESNGEHIDHIGTWINHSGEIPTNLPTFAYENLMQTQFSGSISA
tara:strand:- start:79 stop:387 length:309 start_codon:yes stop_codon:yes gene_type:complete